VINDDKFTEYVFHFREFQDKYGNNKFIYVEDLKEYNKELEQLVEKGAIPKRPYKLFIDDVELQGVRARRHV
jgi:hypothetical protein